MVQILGIPLHCILPRDTVHRSAAACVFRQREYKVVEYYRISGLDSRSPLLVSPALRCRTTPLSCRLWGVLLLLLLLSVLPTSAALNTYKSPTGPSIPHDFCSRRLAQLCVLSTLFFTPNLCISAFGFTSSCPSTTDLVKNEAHKDHIDFHVPLTTDPRILSDSSAVPATSIWLPPPSTSRTSPRPLTLPRSPPSLTALCDSTSTAQRSSSTTSTPKSPSSSIYAASASPAPNCMPSPAPGPRRSASLPSRIY